MRHTWPGNVRELEHVIERALAFCDGDQLGPQYIPPLGEPEAAARQMAAFHEIPKPLTDAVADVESKLIASAIRQADGNQAQAAQILGIPRTTLRDKIAKYAINELAGS